MRISEHEFVPYVAERRMPAGRALVLAPHPDDEVFGCGGAIMRHLESGDPIKVIVVTDGAYGASQEPEVYASQRRAESQAAGEVLGYGSPTFWEFPDRGLEYGESLVLRILSELESEPADILYAPSWWEVHPDHLSLALAAAEAVRRASRPVRLAMYEVGVPLHPNLLLDISQLRERKSEAIRCFASQLTKQPYDRHVNALNLFRTYTLPESIEAAEAYRILTAEELRQDPLQCVRPGRYYAQAVSPASSTPLVSIIVLAMEERSLADVRDSIALQTYPNIEVLVVRSTNPPDSNQAAGENRFPERVIETDSLAALGQGPNQALDLASGAFLLVIERPVRLAANHIDQLVRTLTETPGLGWAHSGVSFGPEAPDTASSVTMLTTPLGTLDLWGGTEIPLAAVMFARSLVTDGCRFDENLSVLDTWDFLVQLSRKAAWACSKDRTLNLVRPAAGPGHASSSSAERAGHAEALAKWARIWDGQELNQILLHRDRLAAEAKATASDLQRRLEQIESGLRVTFGMEDSPEREGRALVEHARATLEHLEREQEILREAVLAERQKAHRAEQDLEAIRNSTAWRLTSPLRRAITRLRGRR